MNNFSEQPGRRVVTDATGLNRFLTRMYGNMVVAILVSAFSAYLTMNTFRQQVFGYFGAHPGMTWIILLLPIALSMGISFSATRNPVGAFIMLMLISIIYGVEFALIAGAYTGASIASAFVSSSVIFIVMAVYGTITKRDLTKFGSHAMAALIALIIAYIINMFLQSPAIAYIFSFIAVIIFTVLTGWDAQKMKRIYVNYGDQVSVTGLAVLGALQLYLDFVNLFISLLQIFGMSDRN
ncbi:Bax inhibitor-1/YccA family protein [Limosilactobacillus fastidiosus]|uniref:Bax inhibitor-1/YccA family protein n=1 Tax=Limosilactobacillus fastidiosus TaxID=2759855 RepID=A0A7W3YCY7_9LACO|nr:Bax inhibitor-1/YccA family protein [Limosilactobacillus fastidiosus]MBB1063678.1 Bax inhibitor-1/YccA family protein [Limosilactobacillus fastidiosus]MBB1086793.1 Bax inhibitor-1/YccA family protein [Limosilactobacillus fastidiosus]MCD7084253.1 Bax inhibitor-1/YccA family protein [Limosilactobacillus fastidiosus]MCD7085480.1 Bax inhibitor-1/YccA family protein [Limosilactobacillus fastidiosus]MCD7114711.1 Bax inhibitor-1/YccA family protein [Limosilactobacillus fastidiosus]